MSTFEELVDKIHLEPNFNLLLSTVGLAGEVGEYANLIKKQYRDNLIQFDKKKKEIADIFIYTILNAKHDDIDIVEAIEEKLELNETKRNKKKFEYSLLDLKEESEEEIEEFENIVLDHDHKLYEMEFKLELFPPKDPKFNPGSKILEYETWQCNLDGCDYHEYRFIGRKVKER